MYTPSTYLGYIICYSTLQCYCLFYVSNNAHTRGTSYSYVRELRTVTKQLIRHTDNNGI